MGGQITITDEDIGWSDVAVFLARTGTVDGTLSFVWDVDQNW